MKEVKTGGGKEFLFSVLWMIFLLFIGRFLTYLLPSYKLFGTLATIAMFGVLGFFVLTRYAAVFTYSLKGYSLRINRTIGKRNKEIEIRISAIKSISKEKPENMPRREYVYNMSSCVFPSKRLWYAEYERNTFREVLIFEPSEEMVNKIKELQQTNNADSERSSI